MNKKGFTLVELLAAIALLGLIIGLAVTGISRGNVKAREKMLAAKVKNIESAAVLYGQDHPEYVNDNLCGIGSTCDMNDDGNINNIDINPLKQCLNGDTCDLEIADANGDGMITADDITSMRQFIAGDYVKYIDVSNLIQEKYLECDKDNLITNPLDESKSLNNCKIYLFKKYGKIYAKYMYKNNSNDDDTTQCWTGK